MELAFTFGVHRCFRRADAIVGFLMIDVSSDLSDASRIAESCGARGFVMYLASQILRMFAMLIARAMVSC